MRMKSIKLWVGSHGDAFRELPTVGNVPNVDAEVANPRAVAAGKRFIDKNLTTSYPGNPESIFYEERLAAENVRKSLGYYATLDMYSLKDHGVRSAAISAERGVSGSVLGFLKHIGLTALVDTDFGINSSATNASTFDIASGEVDAAMRGRLLTGLDDLANAEEPRTAAVGDFRWFRYAKGLHVDTITPDQYQPAAELDLSTPLPKHVVDAAGLSGDSFYLLNWREQPTEDGYWGEIVTEIDAPDSTHWPA